MAKTFAELHREQHRGVAPPDHHWAARRRLAEAVRGLSRSVVTRAATAEAFDRAAALIAEARALLDESEEQAGLLANTRGAGIERFVAMVQELNPVAGTANPLAAPLEMWLAEGLAHGKVTFDWHYEGPPGHVHGGHVAAVLDQFLGFTQVLAGSAGMTGKLELRYVRPTPLHVELRLEGRVKERTGNLTYVEAKMLAGETVTAKATGMFVGIPEGYLQR
jgi:acyl-coenzyme A thioesterase PaaI-like protein